MPAPPSAGGAGGGGGGGGGGDEAREPTKPSTAPPPRRRTFRITGDKEADRAAAAKHAKEEAEAAAEAEARAAAARVCSYCATLSPPTRGAHTFMECEKRKRAKVLEYEPRVLRDLASELAGRLDEVRVRRRELHATLLRAKLSRRKGYQLAGTRAMLAGSFGEPPPPPLGEPPPPPPGCRAAAWRDQQRHARQRARALAAVAARAVRPDASHLGELKGLALMAPPRLKLPLQPATVRQCAQLMRLVLTPGSASLSHLWLAIELARAPLPREWKPVSLGGQMGYQHSATGEVSPRHPLADAFGKLPKPLRDAATTEASNTVDSAGAALFRYWEFAATATGGGGAGGAGGADGATRPPMLIDMCSGAEADLGTVWLPRTSYLPPLQQEPSAKRATEVSAEALRAAMASAGGASLWAAMCKASYEPRNAALAARPRSLSELHVAALYLGFGLRAHPELGWIASAALCAGLPYGWRVAYASSGAPYYYHPALLCSQWEHPTHCHLRGLVQVILGKRL